MGYTYTITYDHYDVGGDVAPLTNTLTNLKPSASAGLTFVEQTPGTALQGTFQLRFNGQTTGPIAYNENAMSVQAALNELSSISPSEVVVTRSGPMRTGGSKGSPGTQVEGYVWSITFMSNVWKDPTVAHDASSVPGNWVGAAALWTDTWDTGFSKAWGKNVGDMPAITCVDTALYTTNGALPSDGCAVAEYTKGSDPLGGTFTVCLDTTGHDVINIQGVQCTGAIAHNAYASAADSGGDGSSMEEKLEALTNIGDLAVSRSNVNMGGNNGGYTWTVTFLRDDDVSGGQFGGCEQKDDANQLCNSPGNVPKFCDAGSCAPNVASMKGSCDNTNVFSSYTPYQTWHSAVPDGKLLGVTVTAGGTGYGSAPAVTIGAPDHWNGIQATATATLTAGVVTSITLTNQGTGYTSVPTVSFASGAAAATAVIQSPPPYGQHFNCSYVTILDAASTLPPPSSVETQVFYLKDPDYAGWDEGTENDNSIEKLYAIEFYGYYSNCLRNTDSATEFGWAFERAFNATQGDTSITEITQLTHYSINRGTSETLAPNGYVYTINFHGAEGDIADPGTANGLRFHYSLGAQFDATAASVFDFTTNEIIVSALEYAQFITGDEVKYDKGIGGAAITGLVDDRSYFVIKSATANRISLAATKADALAGTPKIGLSVVAGSGTAHWLRSRPFTEMCGESTTPTVISTFDGSTVQRSLELPSPCWLLSTTT
jgi:hypothetical protein